MCHMSVSGPKSQEPSLSAFVASHVSNFCSEFQVSKEAQIWRDLKV